MHETLGILFFAVGLLLDGINLVWGFQSARGKPFKSGIILIPLFLYVGGGLLLCSHRGPRFLILVVLGMTVLHALCYQILPWLFDLLFRRNGKATGHKG